MNLKFDSITKQFGDRIILNSISFSVQKGEIVFVLGQSGTGKSVLLKCLVGLLKPESGRILIDGRDIVPLSETEMFEVRKKCGMVFQQPALFDSLSIFDNVAYGLRKHFRLSDLELKSKVQQAIESVHLSLDILEKWPRQISYGMQKRVSLARTLVLEPEVLLFDEPTTGLDPVTTNAINQLIQEVSKIYKTTSLVVSHDMNCAMQAADRIIFLDRGRKIFDGDPSQVKSSRHPLVQEFFHEVEA
jgi:phospholipid/cholesterol/gamma-HCH transport system ATP-binding protein